MSTIENNAAALTAQMQWLANVIDTRMQLYWQRDCSFTSIAEVPVPSLDDESVFSSIVKHYQMDIAERLTLLMALVPHVQPHLLDVFFVKNADYDRAFTEFGGVKGQNHNGFIPTGETIAFLLAPNDLQQRFVLYDIFSEDHFFGKFNILKLENIHSGEPLLSGVLRISSEYLNLLTTGQSYKPDYSVNFPAKRIATNLNWEDLVLDHDTLDEVMEIQDWITHGNTLLKDWGLDKKIKPGYRTLFYGPPGTGKTLTASLLGKATGLDVYRIDLSMVVSKYIGETEKNLANIFDQAENKSWILFFDEADALFGKRTQASSSNDRHANQEVSYLLQRVEDFPGVVILATNIKANLDDAFSRRFQSMIHFAMPGPAQRKILWKQAFSSKTVCDVALDQKMPEIATKYEMAGGAIINVVRYASLMAIKRGNNELRYDDVMNGIRKEFRKDGKTA
ncbi:ATP-binding protein [Mucilaginibacter sp. HMF5004]|uniref:ATP-binding protein n=1 Tax=Mucilaginibacter rivuli TaxID=2857527 RepID=UPI001C5F469D|nr:ATP-binding protein [Mucilaginibacter rivuli]MBW4891586.1 ATP-binding protein [Mucilaginibacter rivuli]